MGVYTKTVEAFLNEGNFELDATINWAKVFKVIKS